MKKPVSAFLTPLAILLALLVLAPAAIAEELIPPGNSAVNQYTESLPTPRGDRDTEGRSGGKSNRSPEEALGKRNAQRLEKHGSDGREAAEAAAATAPASTTVDETDPVDAEETTASPSTGGGDGGDRGGGVGESAPADAGAAGKPRSPVGEPSNVSIDEPSGSSGFGEVLSEATGTSSDGQLGWLLPLLVVAIAAWALAYATQRRRRVS